MSSKQQLSSYKHVIKTLAKQAELVRQGFPLDQRYGHLHYFREALQQPDFREVAKDMRIDIGLDLFASLEEIEAMERGYLNGHASELVVQAYIILDFIDRMGWNELHDGNFEERQQSIFRHCLTLEQVADLRYRLAFVSEWSTFHVDIESDALLTVLQSDMGYTATWQGMILVFNAVHPDMWLDYLNEFFLALEDNSMEIPKPAATLLLSFICDAFFSHRQQPPYSEGIVSELLELGASLMISTDGHAPLFRSLCKDHPQPEGASWPVEAPRCELHTDARCPTALSRLLKKRWSPGFKELLSRHACCALDASSPSSEVFPTKLPSLACLAARQVRDSDLECLPPRLLFTTMKHQPLEASAE